MENELHIETEKRIRRKVRNNEGDYRLQAESMTKSWKRGIDLRGIDLDRSCIPPQKFSSHVHNVIMHTRERFVFYARKNSTARSVINVLEKQDFLFLDTGYVFIVHSGSLGYL